jgi:Protein of unknown function (DUF3285)
MSPPPTPQPGEPRPAERVGQAAMGTSQVETSSFIKLAMRNMVRKGRQSLVHFGLTALGLTGFLVLIAWLGRPSLPQ